MQAVAEKPGKLVLPPGWVAFAALALAVPISVLLLRPSPAPGLPLLAELPAFSLIAEDGTRFGKEDLLGRVWVAGLVLTSRSGARPRLQAEVNSLQARLAPPQPGRA